jgi:hypothetical protein
MTVVDFIETTARPSQTHTDDTDYARESGEAAKLKAEIAAAQAGFTGPTPSTFTPIQHTFPGMDAPPQRKKLTAAERLAIAKKRHEDFIARREAAAEAKRKPDKGEYKPAQIATRDEIDFRHSAWETKRNQVWHAMQEAGCSAPSIFNFSNCGADAVICYDKDEERYFLAGQHCHSRHCEPCMRAKANLMAANFRQKVEAKGKGHFRFLTLTLKHQDAPLRDQITRLRECFTKLRKEKLWTASVDGGAAMLEVKWIKDTGDWHPHLHVILEGTPIQGTGNQQGSDRLASAWYKITGDSYRIDLRELDDAKTAAYYIVKYTAKGSNIEMWWDQPASVEFIQAMKGQRSVMTFGCWRGYALLQKPPERENWFRVGTLSEIVRMMADGSKWAHDIICHVHRTCCYDPTRRSKKQPRAANAAIAAVAAKMS